MTASTEWQLEQNAAERYQAILTPTILGPFAEALVDFAQLQAGESVLDVGCGTGAAARYAAEVVGQTGAVTGLDVNGSMLAIAEALPAVQGAPLIWQKANAADLPFGDDQFDVVLCAQMLQFVPDKAAVLAELKRVVKPSGRIAISLWCPITDSPYFDTLVTTIAEQIGADTAVGLHAAFKLSDTKTIHRLLQTAGFEQINMQITPLELPLPPLNEFIPRHISATPMAAGFNSASTATQQAVIQQMIGRLGRYTQNGRVQIPFKSHMIKL